MQKKLKFILITIILFLGMVSLISCGKKADNPDPITPVRSLLEAQKNNDFEAYKKAFYYEPGESYTHNHDLGVNSLLIIKLETSVPETKWFIENYSDIPDDKAQKTQNIWNKNEFQYRFNSPYLKTHFKFPLKWVFMLSSLTDSQAKLTTPIGGSWRSTNTSMTDTTFLIMGPNAIRIEIVYIPYFTIRVHSHPISADAEPTMLRSGTSWARVGG